MMVGVPRTLASSCSKNMRTISSVRAPEEEEDSAVPLKERERDKSCLRRLHLVCGPSATVSYSPSLTWSMRPLAPPPLGLTLRFLLPPPPFPPPPPNTSCTRVWRCERDQCSLNESDREAEECGERVCPLLLPFLLLRTRREYDGFRDRSYASIWGWWIEGVGGRWGCRR